MYIYCSSHLEIFDETTMASSQARFVRDIPVDGIPFLFSYPDYSLVWERQVISSFKSSKWKSMVCQNIGLCGFCSICVMFASPFKPTMQSVGIFLAELGLASLRCDHCSIEAGIHFVMYFPILSPQCDVERLTDHREMVVRSWTFWQPTWNHRTFPIVIAFSVIRRFMKRWILFLSPWCFIALAFHDPSQPHHVIGKWITVFHHNSSVIAGVIQLTVIASVASIPFPVLPKRSNH